MQENYINIDAILHGILFTPKDWLTISDNQHRAEILVMSFIGYCARPNNIPEDVLTKCIRAFNNNRGKVETEIEAVYKVLENEK